MSTNERLCISDLADSWTICRQQDAVEGDKQRLLGVATEAEQEREMSTDEVERLTKELMSADDFAAEKERDFINAKEARRVLAAQLAEAKCVPAAAAAAAAGAHPFTCMHGAMHAAVCVCMRAGLPTSSALSTLPVEPRAGCLAASKAL